MRITSDTKARLQTFFNPQDNYCKDEQWSSLGEEIYRDLHQAIELKGFEGFVITGYLSSIIEEFLWEHPGETANALHEEIFES